jgi:hypothetical protein
MVAVDWGSLGIEANNVGSAKDRQEMELQDHDLK